MDSRSGVVVVEKKQIDDIIAERREGRVKIVRHIRRREPRPSRAVGVTPLADDDNLVAVPAIPDPGPERPFAVPIYARGVE